MNPNQPPNNIIEPRKQVLLPPMENYGRQGTIPETNPYPGNLPNPLLFPAQDNLVRIALDPPCNINQPPNNKYPMQKLPTEPMPTNNGFGIHNGYQNGLQRLPSNPFNPPPSNQLGYAQQPTYGPNHQLGFDISKHGSLLKYLLADKCQQIFSKHDLNRSGQLDVREVIPAMNELFTTCGKMQPSQEQIMLVMRSFDQDRNGLLSVEEFKKIAFILNDVLF